MIKLEDVLTDEEIRRLSNETRGTFAWVRACIAKAVEKAEKVEGCVGVAIDPQRQGGFYFNAGAPQNSAYRHALLLLGPKYEPPKKPCPTCGELKHSGSRMATTKPLKSADKRIAADLLTHHRRPRMRFREVAA